jgi:hypothetical protein
MDRNEEFKIMQMLDEVISEHASHIQDQENAHREKEFRMHISSARVQAREELKELLVKQLREAYQGPVGDRS